MSKQFLPDLFIIPDIDHARAQVTFTPPAKCSSVQWMVSDEKGFSVQGNASLPSSGTARIEIDMSGFTLWSLDNPHLYTLILRLAHGPSIEPVEEREMFGMRSIRTEGQTILLNNEPFYPRAYIRGRRAHDYHNFRNLSLSEFYRRNIEAGKRHGFNMIRFHSQVPPRECFEMADRLGMLIHVEMRQYFGLYQAKERAKMKEHGRIIDEQEWQDMILRIRNHPSLAVYCVGNEIRNPAHNPFIAQLAHLTNELDPTRLFLDTCAHGEFDRTYVSFDVQHMSYFYPYGKNGDMFENTYNWLIHGSATGLPLTDQDDEFDPTYRMTRAIPSDRPRPTLAHEICHYIALRDLDALERKLAECQAEKPWWIDELKKLVREKGLEADYPKMLEASRRFQFMSWKLGIEACRRSPLLSGFHFLQFTDTDYYENANGVVDFFDESKGTSEEDFLQFNGDSVLLADLPRRTFFEQESLTIPLLISHYGSAPAPEATIHFSLERADGSTVFRKGALQRIDLQTRGRHELCRISLTLPELEQPEALQLVVRLETEDGAWAIANRWDLWVFPNRPSELPAMTCTLALDDETFVQRRYPQLKQSGTVEQPEQLLITHRFTEPVIEHLRQGGDVLMCYRVPQTRDRRAYPRGVRPTRETYALPAVWDRFKGVIWDRGHNLGAFIRPSPALNGFPTDGYMDLQFYGLVEDSDKIILDDFPVPIQPLIQGVDRPVRDRYDVNDWQLSEFQPAHTMRKFAYLFEVRVGKGRLLVTGFNFTGVDRGCPETCAMFESLIRYIQSENFAPEATMTPEQLEAYLLEKGRGPLVRERKMTQYWQLDEEPLESARYWTEALEYLKEGVGDQDQE